MSPATIAAFSPPLVNISEGAPKPIADGAELSVLHKCPVGDWNRLTVNWRAIATPQHLVLTWYAKDETTGEFVPVGQRTWDVDGTLFNIGTSGLQSGVSLTTMRDTVPNVGNYLDVTVRNRTGAGGAGMFTMLIVPTSRGDDETQPYRQFPDVNGFAWADGILRASGFAGGDVVAPGITLLPLAPYHGPAYVIGLIGTVTAQLVAFDFRSVTNPLLFLDVIGAVDNHLTYLPPLINKLRIDNATGANQAIWVSVVAARNGRF